MWIYIFKGLTIANSLFLLKLILGADSLSETRFYLIAFAVAGGLSLLEFGLGDYLLQKIRVGDRSDRFFSKIRRLLYILITVSALSVGIAILNWPKISLEMIYVMVGIFIYSIVNVLLGIHQKLAFVINEFKLSYFYFTCTTLAVIISAAILNLVFEIRVAVILIILYSNLLIAFFVIIDFLKLNNIFVDNKEGNLPLIGRAGLSLENILNSLTLMFVGITIAALPTKEEVGIFTIYARVVNVVSMFGMIYVLTIWQSGRQNSILGVVMRYVFASLLIMTILSALEKSWIHLFMTNYSSQISLSLLIASSLILWRILGDLLSQISKLKSIAWIVIYNAIIQFLLVSISLVANHIKLLNINVLIGLFIMGWIVSGGFLIYVFARKG